MLRSTPDQAAVRVEQLLKRTRDLEKDLAAAKQALVTGQATDHSEAVEEISGIKVLATRMDGADAKTLRDAVDRFKEAGGNDPSKLDSALKSVPGWVAEQLS